MRPSEHTIRDEVCESGGHERRGLEFAVFRRGSQVASSLLVTREVGAISVMYDF